MFLYATALRRASFLMVNSSWTKNHVDSILNHNDAILEFFAWMILLPWTITSTYTKHEPPRNAKIVYPPCETGELVNFSPANRERVILSVAQFRYVLPVCTLFVICGPNILLRPEKEHSTQLQAFKALLANHPELKSGQSSVKLVLIGGCRNEEDTSRVDGLKSLAKDLNVSVRCRVFDVKDRPWILIDPLSTFLPRITSNSS